MDDLHFMRIALEEAQKAARKGEVPVGAVIVRDEEVLSRAHNLRETSHDPTAHAEVLAIREAARKLRNWRLLDSVLYVTKEPCPMCAAAIVHARIKRVVYGCRDPKGGAVESLYNILSDRRLNHQVEFSSGVLEEESAEILKGFFRERRQNPS